MFSWLYENNFKKPDKHIQRKIVNIHPSLLPKYKGLNTFKRIIKDKEVRLDVLFIMLMKS